MKLSKQDRRQRLRFRIRKTVQELFNVRAWQFSEVIKKFMLN